jgi:hypothetical protein
MPEVIGISVFAFAMLYCGRKAAGEISYFRMGITDLVK